MIPDLPELVNAIVGLIATSREGISFGAIALLSLVNDLMTLLRGGTIKDAS